MGSFARYYSSSVSEGVAAEAPKGTVAMFMALVNTPEFELLCEKEREKRKEREKEKEKNGGLPSVAEVVAESLAALGLNFDDESSSEENNVHYCGALFLSKEKLPPAGLQYQIQTHKYSGGHIK
ncbi:hypothetical protein MKX03_026876 [Papaver bracteatum]|nr:hypothetical protein MKX03_026876 [Papaver bracteatum]